MQIAKHQDGRASVKVLGSYPLKIVKFFMLKSQSHFYSGTLYSLKKELPTQQEVSFECSAQHSPLLAKLKKNFKFSKPIVSIQ